MKILIYTHDTCGLGNIRRMLSIAEYLNETLEDATVLMVSGSPMLQSFRMDKRIDYVKLPTVTRSVDGRYSSRSLGMSLKKTIRMRDNLIMGTVLDFKPDVILVDKKPLGLKKELHNTFNFLRQRKQLPRIYLVLRDILDDAESTHRMWRNKGYFEAVEDYYHRILVLGNQAVFDVASQYRFPTSCCAKLHYCGYLDRSLENTPDVHAIRQQIGIHTSNKKLILVTPGGGADGADVVQHFLQYWRQATATQDAHAVVVHGPELKPQQQRLFEQLARQCRHLTLLEFTPHMLGFMRAADTIVCMAGYNTLCEALILKKKVLCIPRTKPVLEQLMRANCLASAGLIHLLHPEQLDAKCFARSFESVMQQAVPDHSTRYLSFNGLQQVAAHICQSDPLPQSSQPTAVSETGKEKQMPDEINEPMQDVSAIKQYFNGDGWPLWSRWFSNKTKSYKEASYV